MARMIHHSVLSLALTAAALLSGAPATAQIVSGGDDEPASVPMMGRAVSDEALAQDGTAAPLTRSEARAQARTARASRPRVELTPYIAVNQVLSADFTDGSDLFTYTTLAAGAEASIATRRAQVSADVRYERRIAWNRNLADDNVVTGVLRGRYDIGSGLSFEAGGLATRGGDGGFSGVPDLATQTRSGGSGLYSLYAAPTFARSFDRLDVGAQYRYGYNRQDFAINPALAGVRSFGAFDRSTNQALLGSIGMRPGGRLPFGWSLTGGYEEDRSSELSQRYRTYNARLNLTKPVSQTLAVVASVGYEDIAVSNRVPLVDASGAPVVNAGGQLVSDPGQPRQIAFATSGLIYDAGVLWRPSRRTSLEARVGRRYGDWTFNGSASWQASEATSYQLSIYDTLTTFGRQLTAGIAALPTDFSVVRNPIDGSIGGCAFGANDSSCLQPTIANVSGFAYRNQGVTLAMSSRLAGWKVRAALGYDRRRYVANSGGPLSTIAGSVDESLFAYLAGSNEIGRDTELGLSAYVSDIERGYVGSLDSLTAGVAAQITHAFLRRLDGQAAASVNLIDTDGFNSAVYASALLGLRYTF